MRGSMTFRKPNLFIVGAMKSGTSSLHSWLGAHPAIFMCEPKEPCYFVEPSQLRWPAAERLGLWGKEEQYLRLFANSGDAAFLGESSTLYTKAPRVTGVPERIAGFNPDARIIYVMRDPVERTISHYWHQVRWEKEHRDMLGAIREEAEYLAVSNYAMQLGPYLRLFHRERVLALTFERLIADPQVVVSEVFRWLGVDPSFVPPNITEAENRTPSVVQQVRGQGRLEAFRFSRVWNTVGPLVPAALRQVARRRLAMRAVTRPTDSPIEAIEFLRDAQVGQVQRLSALLGQTFPEWRMLYDTWLEQPKCSR